MSSGPTRDLHARLLNESSPDRQTREHISNLDQDNTSRPHSTDSSAAPLLPGNQPVYPQPKHSEAFRPSSMALQPPLLPSLPPSFGHQRSTYSNDSSPSRTSLPSPRQTHHKRQRVETPDSSPIWPDRRTSDQKRSFRQRRKDPSCDACRERKVKCDATDSRSCTECANRGVRCQFTKDTNRRMSSIKQVQELERQLAQMRQQNEHLTLMINSGNRMDQDPTAEPKTFSLSPITGPERLNGYVNARRNVIKHARGIFKPPASHRLKPTQPKVTVERSLLPDREEAGHLIEACRQSFIKQLALIDWDQFLEAFNAVYETWATGNVSRPWLALFFSVLAMGALQSHNTYTGSSSERRDRAQALETQSSKCLSIADENVTLDHCRAALLLSVFHVEANQKIAGRTWLSVAVSFAFELGLQYHTNGPTPRESELRLQLWWSVYSWERLLSLEMSQPSLIDDDDCQAVFRATHSSATLDEPFLQSSSNSSDYLQVPRTVMSLMRLYGSVRKVQKSADVTSSTLAELESLSETVSATYPGSMQPAILSSRATNRFTLTLLISNAKLILYRQNLSPLCTAEQRSDALQGCVAAAHDTVRGIKDSLTHPEGGILGRDGSSADWSAWMQSASSSLTCTHFWRCILILALAQDFESAIVCAKASSAIGDQKEVNTSCGNNLIFFLEVLAEKMKGYGDGGRRLLEDMEMLAYVSGDVQGDVRTAWIWQGSGEAEEDEGPLAGLKGGGALGEAMEEGKSWASASNVWSRVHSLLQHLRSERTRQMRSAPRHGTEAEQRHAEEKVAAPSKGVTPRRREGVGGANKRMSIANII